MESLLPNRIGEYGAPAELVWGLTVASYERLPPTELKYHIVPFPLWLIGCRWQTIA